MLSTAVTQMHCNTLSTCISTGANREFKMPHSQYLVLSGLRHLYGMKFLALYASSHPSDPSCLANPQTSTWTPIKAVNPIGASDLDTEFTAIYESKIHHDIVSVILAALPESDWGLNVLRLGFESDRLKNPITIHLVVAENGGLSEDTACKIVADTCAIIAAALNSSQS